MATRREIAQDTIANFIKLGQGGEWEEECVRDGVIRFGYGPTPHELCLAKDWQAVRQFWLGRRKNNGTTATNDTNQIKAFYETNEQSVFITFKDGSLYWCHPKGPIEVMEGGERKRGTVDGWHRHTLGGIPLTVDRLSGSLLKVQMFRGTICQVKQRDYLIRKLNDQLLPEVTVAFETEAAYLQSIQSLLGLLTWQDFELLVDLIFASSGWRRISALGKTQKTVDMEVELPTTGERAFIQVKSEASTKTILDYENRFKGSDGFSRMFFVWHSGKVDAADLDARVVPLGPMEVARLVLDVGLARWLREKVS